MGGPSCQIEHRASFCGKIGFIRRERVIKGERSIESTIVTSYAALLAFTGQR